VTHNAIPAPVETSQLNSSYRHITPPPAQRTLQSRTINQVHNTQSMSRFEPTTQVESASKVAELERQLENMKKIASNLQKEKDLALKFNSLLLRKLENVGVGAGDRILQVN